MHRSFFQRKPKQIPRRGAAAVEMALVCPIALTLIFGIMQVGYGFMVQHQLQSAARQACRVASFRGSTNASVTTLVNSAVSSVSGLTTTITLNNAVADVATAKYGDLIGVKVQVPLASVLLFNVTFANFTGTIDGADSMRCE